MICLFEESKHTRSFIPMHVIIGTKNTSLSIIYKDYVEAAELFTFLIHRMNIVNIYIIYMSTQRESSKRVRGVDADNLNGRAVLCLGFATRKEDGNALSTDRSGHNDGVSANSFRNLKRNTISHVNTTAL